MYEEETIRALLLMSDHQIKLVPPYWPPDIERDSVLVVPFIPSVTPEACGKGEPMQRKRNRCTNRAMVDNNGKREESSKRQRCL